MYRCALLLHTLGAINTDDTLDLLHACILLTPNYLLSMILQWKKILSSTLSAFFQTLSAQLATSTAQHHIALKLLLGSNWLQHRLYNVDEPMYNASATSY